VNFFDADRPAGKKAKTVLKFIVLCPKQMRPQLVTVNDLVLKGIINIPYPMSVTVRYREPSPHCPE
jgi:hypothetical protein